MKVLIIALCVVAFLLFAGIKIMNGFNDIQESFTNDLPMTYSILPEDSTLLEKNYWSKLKADKIVNFKNRAPISILSFDQKYYLIINKIAVGKAVSLQNILHETNKSTDRTVGEVYSVINLNESCQFQYRSSFIKPTSEIFLTLAGDSIQSIKGNNVVSYHLLCKDFSIRYLEKGAIDIYVTGKEMALGTKASKPMSMLFLKRGSKVYFLLMIPIDPNGTISPNLLYSIVDTSDKN